MAALMAYALVDDGYDEDEKIEDALASEPAVIAFHVMAITYCNRRNTDGKIRQARVDRWLSMTPYTTKQKQRVLNVLLELRLFELHDDEHYTVHNFLKWNRSRARRAELAQQGRRGGLAKAKATAKPGPEPPPSQGSSHGLANGSSPPRQASPSQAKENVNTNAELRSATLECFAYWQEKCGHQQAHPSGDRLSRIKARLLERQRFHSGEMSGAIGDCRQAIDGAALAAFVDDRGKRHDGIELVFRNNSKLEDFMGRAAAPVVPIRDRMSELDRKRLASANRLMGGGAA